MPLMTSRWQRLRGGDLAIDLGTSRTLIWRKGRGVALDEPSLLAVEGGTGKVLAAGERARGLIGRTPAHVHIMRPVRDGVIVDADVAESMLRTFIDQVHSSWLNRPRVVVAAPSQITAVERRALEETVLRSGAREVFIVEEAMVAAIGAGLPVNDERASMVLDLGGGTADGAITALGGIVRSGSAREAMAEPLAAISAFARNLVDQCPPDLTGDIVARGIVLTGGVAQLRGIDRLLARNLSLPVVVAKDPQRAVIRGAGRCIDDLHRLRRIVVGEQRY